MGEKTYAFLVLGLVATLLGSIVPTQKMQELDQLTASLVFSEIVTPENLKNDYEAREPLRVLIVPGHDSENSGAMWNGVKEATLTLEQGEKLLEIFKKDPHFEATLSRNDIAYHAGIASYFTEKRDAVRAFREGLKSVSKELMESGTLEKRQSVYHNRAQEEVSLRLYAINKWANDNNIDLVIHIHFNDIPRSLRSPGRYSGFSIYIPESQLGNHRASRELAESVHRELSKYFPKSDYPPEKDGLTEDQVLIAIGAHGSLHSAVLFMEYEYIYESQVTHLGVRSLVMQEYAQQTYNGIKNYFENKNSFSDTATLPYTWGKDLGKDVAETDDDVFALQIALAREGLYPPQNYRANDCPPSGKFLFCTYLSVIAFQKKYGLPETGFVGPKTRNLLNDLYSRS